jgi:hypothetical protein
MREWRANPRELTTLMRESVDSKTELEFLMSMNLGVNTKFTLGRSTFQQTQIKSNSSGNSHDNRQNLHKETWTKYGNGKNSGCGPVATVVWALL